MMKRIASSLGLLVLVAVFSSCATVKKPTVIVVDETTSMSQTVVQAQKSINAPTGLKRKVAIARFTDETKRGQSIFIDAVGAQHLSVARQAVDILSAKLMETEKFILLERNDFDQISAELEIGDFSPLKNMADYLIVGSITEFGRRIESEVRVFSRSKRQTAFAKVHVRLVDVRTGQVLYSEEGAGESFSEVGTVLGAGSRAGYDTSINDKALDTAITSLASNIIENLMDRPWRSYVLGYEDGQILMAGGASQNIEMNTIFVVVQEGRKVKNPQTNMMITLPGTDIAKIRTLLSIGDTEESEITLCEIVEGNLSTYIESGNFENLYIREAKSGGE